jgi:glucan endo-1,3-alpha-glucosidase
MNGNLNGSQMRQYLSYHTLPWSDPVISYTAAANSNTGFKLFMSFDMTSLPCSNPDSAQTLRKYITTYATHPNQLIYDGRVFASTFSGEACTFGQSSVLDGWSSQFTKHPDLTGPNSVLFVPSFFIDPATFNNMNQIMDGAFNVSDLTPCHQ